MLFNKWKIGNCYSTNAGLVQRPEPAAREPKDIRGMCSIIESIQSVQRILIKVLALY